MIERFAFDGGRQVTVYVPSGWPDAVVFAGDGQATSRWAQALEAAGLRSTMIVGVHRLEHEGRRRGEYSPDVDPVGFAAHERFFLEDLRRGTDSPFGVALPAARTAESQRSLVVSDEVIFAPNTCPATSSA